MIATKLDPKEKERFTHLVRKIGMTPAGAVRVFITMFNERGGFPFSLEAEPVYRAETRAAMKEARQIATDATAPSYGSASELFAALDAEIAAENETAR